MFDCARREVWRQPTLEHTATTSKRFAYQKPPLAIGQSDSIDGLYAVCSAELIIGIILIILLKRIQCIQRAVTNTIMN